MKIGLAVDGIRTEEAGFTKTRLAMTAVNMGHEVWWLGVGDFILSPDGTIRHWTPTGRGRKRLVSYLGRWERCAV